MGGLQVHGIRSCWLVYKEVVEVRSNYEKSYFWWFGNPACGDSAGSNQIEKDKVVYLLDLLEGMGKKEPCDLVCGGPADDWVNADYVDVLFAKCGFNSFGSWSYSKE